MFSIYLVYLYKFNVKIHPAQISLQYDQVPFRIVNAMGATVDISYFIYFLFDPEYSEIITISGTILLLIQRAVIMISFMSTKKMPALCKVQLCSRD